MMSTTRILSLVKKSLTQSWAAFMKLGTAIVRKQLSITRGGTFSEYDYSLCTVCLIRKPNTATMKARIIRTTV